MCAAPKECAYSREMRRTNDDDHSRTEDNERGGRGCVRVLYTGNLYVLKSMEGPNQEEAGRGTNTKADDSDDDGLDIVNSFRWVGILVYKV
jgi:hypothetical protein